MLLTGMNRRHVSAIAIAVIGSLGAAVFLYDYLMPAWVYVERSDGDTADIMTIIDEDLMRYPILQDLILEADESLGLSIGAIEATSRSEASELVELLEIRDENDSHRGNFIYDDKRYYVHVFYQYDPPALA